MNFPFTISKKASIIYLSLSVQGTSVNVFTCKAAEQLNGFFDQLQPDDASLIVFQSKKPYSFLNGAELILTGAVKELSDIANFTEQIRSAYEKIFRSPIPTVAAIQGNCYGCGMEFALCCDYRLASSSYDTHFYLTELKDYMVLPIFGAIEKLPHIVGINAAIDLLIFGKTWHADEAVTKRLVDKTLSAERFDDEVEDYIQRLLTSQPEKQLTRWGQQTYVAEQVLRLTKESEAQIRKRIYSLPPCQHMIHLKCLDLLIEAANNDAGTLSLENTTKNTFDTLVSKASRNATSFFFVRSMARVSSIGTAVRIPDREVKVILSDNKNDPFHDILYNRRINDLVLLEETNPGIKQYVTQPVSFYVVLDDNSGRIQVQVAWGYNKAIKADLKPFLYFPEPYLYDICEVHLSLNMLSEIKRFLILLDHLGWQPVVTYIVEVSPVNMLLHAYLEYVERVSARSDKINVLNFSLWSFGFELLPDDIAKAVYNKSSYSRDFTPDRVDESLVNGLLQELYKTAMAILYNKWLKHTSQIDVLMRTLFGFPLAKGSFCSFIKNNEE